METKNQSFNTPKSLFASTLTLLIDGSQLCGRKQWAEILGVTDAAISQWLNDKTLPSPEFLRMILDTVRRNANKVPKGVIEEFEMMMTKPASEVTPFGSRMGPSVQAYLVKPLLDSFHQVLNSLLPEVQERLLPRLTELCLEDAGILDQTGSAIQPPSCCPEEELEDGGVTLASSPTYVPSHTKEAVCVEPHRLEAYTEVGGASSGRLAIAEYAFTAALKRALQLYRGSNFDGQFSSVRDYFIDEYHSANIFVLRQMFSWVLVTLDSSFETFKLGKPSSGSRLSCALAESAIRFGNDPHLAYSLTQDCLEDGWHNNISLFNSLNMSVIVRDDDYTHSSWIRFANRVLDWHSQQEMCALLVAEVNWPAVYRYTMILAGDARALSVSDLESLEESFQQETVISAVSGQEIKIFDEQAYTLRPTLAGWCERNSSGFLISDSIRKRAVGDMFVYGPMQEFVKAPGVPAIRLATALVQLGVPPENAWHISDRLRGNGTLVFVHSRSPLNPRKSISGSRGLPYGFEIVETTASHLRSLAGSQSEAARAIGAGV